MHKTPLICVAELTAPHGVRGLLRLRVFLDDGAALFALPLQKADGTAVAITQRGQQKQGYLVTVSGVATRAAADAWRGTKLYVPRTALPEPAANEFYVDDLRGLTVFDESGAKLGTVTTVYDFGAGVSIEIKRPQQAALIVPFNNRCVPVVDVAAGRLIVVPPHETEVR